MPHFVVHTNASFLATTNGTRILQCINERAEASGLFPNSTIKVRIIPFENSIVGGEHADIIHIVAWIMGGRTTEQKKALADSIIIALKDLLPEIPTLSIDIRNIDPSTYSNREMVGKG